MSSLAGVITGLSEKDLRKYDFTTIMSKDEVRWPRGVQPRGNPRLSAGMIIGFEDRDEKRRKIKSSKTKGFK
ncbi:MAG: hypothetical protein JW984_13745 [Deltaproteobacteria bacterium]|uniref:Uncharacterized protein n=1 Tax=Candidatus Zymogenus saltonus TaxID=2844893 RepID=A0A9D8KIJ1_9DELT|nr:hypothetical protein [Candidatus Zymogenus saltonus]